MTLFARESRNLRLRNVGLRLSLASLIALLCVMETPALAVTYSDNGDGTVTDPNTGLTWMRCSMGQTWTGSSCDGPASTYGWDLADFLTLSFAGNSDWRLPNIRELLSIVDWSASYPAINAAAFPNTPSSQSTPNISRFWSATVRPNSTYAWLVVFNTGASSTYLKGEVFQARLVRAGQSSAVLNPARPDSDYVAHGDGTVTHTPTGLIWKQCVEGTTWSAGSCTGSASYLTWTAAQVLTSTFAGKDDWRLPAIEELLTLVDYTRSNPAINTSVFPGTHSTAWSASTWSENPNMAWRVDLLSAGYGTIDSKGTTYQVNLVRGGQASGSSTSTTTSTSTSSTATPTTTTTSVASTTTTTLATTTLNFDAGWNLVGNTSSDVLDVAAAFGDAAKVSTVWKWIANSAKWAFYAPSLIGPALTDYAASKSYDVLTNVTGGEGFWVNAKLAGSVNLPGGSAIGVTALGPKLINGWNLAALGETATPKQFCDAQIGGVTTLWAWDATNSAWYFYAPSLDTSGNLSSYITSKGYLDFTATGKTLGAGVGFWVNKP